MTRISLVDSAHQIVAKHLLEGDIALDATIGNGHDTLFLAKCIGDHGQVFGFDVQAQALINTQLRIQNHALSHRVTLFQASHAEMQKFIPGNFHNRINAAMFNLGYLPGGDKTIITRSLTTLAALNSACELLAERGMITILAYPGHSGGDLEMLDLFNWCTQLDQTHFQFEITQSQFRQSKAPQLFVIRKLGFLL